jgi:ribosomal protein RSM22 (predicted rRNA methylase)
MTSPALPPALRAAVEQAAHGLSRNEASRKAQALSQTYRAGGTSAAIRARDDALAYALTRMPATYAAVAASLCALAEIRPDFAPRSLLDIGAGPGTATWAATEAFPSLDDLTLLDSNAALRALALDLAQGHPHLPTLRYEAGDARRHLADAPAADLVIASYVVNELGDAEHATLADTMWEKTRDTLLIVEPGTPAGSARIVELRARLIAHGAHALAPCPHDEACPLQPPDWCHFTQRLPRSRAHKHLKGADLPFEDEKFSYVALSRTGAASRLARILAQPQVTKVAVTAKLCTPTGLVAAAVPHRDKARYAGAKKWTWGDAVAPDEIARPE